MLKTAIKAAEEGGKILEQYFETFLEKKLKEDLSIVTKADEEAEAKIIEIIKSAFPRHDIIGEESGEEKQGSAYQWFIDPLDGTANFANGIPLFAVSIGVAKEGEPIVSVILNPIIPSLFYAEKGKGAFWNNHKMVVSNEDAKSGMITIGSGKSKDKPSVNELFTRSLNYVKKVRYLGCAALELAYLARGGTEGFVNLGTQKWDYAAGALLVLEAGGKITDLKGDPWNLEQNYFIASNGVIHQQFLELVGRIDVAK